MIRAVIELIDEVRLLYNRLVEIVPELHGPAAVSAPQRAVLEYLHRQGGHTVPAMARARNVTRQYIQTIVNELRERGLIAVQPNPAHRRSSLIVLTDSGRLTIEAMLAREREHLVSHLADIEESDIRAAARTLAVLRRRL